MSSQQLNSHIGDAVGDETVTAKTFRTWAGTVAAFERAEASGATIKDISNAAATRLYNTPTVARSIYIHPDVIDLAGAEKLAVGSVKLDGLFAVEQHLLALLKSGA